MHEKSFRQICIEIFLSFGIVDILFNYDCTESVHSVRVNILCPSQLLGIPPQILQQGLTHRKIEAKSEEVFQDNISMMMLCLYNMLSISLHKV